MRPTKTCPLTSSRARAGLPSLRRVVAEPKNSLVRQYTKIFEMEGVKLEFTEGALDAIAREAVKRETGARSLRSIMENLMLEIMFELPSRKDIRECIITEEVVEKGLEPLLILEGEAQARSA